MYKKAVRPERVQKSDSLAMACPGSGQRQTLYSAIGRADKAMYYGQNTGRNRCILALSDEEMVTLE
jgi:hypothetical protein